MLLLSLVLAFIMSAKQAAGADVFNYVRKNEYTAEEGMVTGVTATDQLTGEEIHIKGKAVIDCCGPWAPHTNHRLEYRSRICWTVLGPGSKYEWFIDNRERIKC